MSVVTIAGSLVGNKLHITKETFGCSITLFFIISATMILEHINI